MDLFQVKVDRRVGSQLVEINGLNMMCYSTRFRK